MSKTKVYSTRLSFEEGLDKETMSILDSLDQEENGTLGFKPTHWIREAVLLRVEMQLYMMKETGTDLQPKQIEDLKAWLLELAKPVEVQQGFNVMEGLDQAQILDGQVAKHLSQMDQEQQQSWMLDAVRMRYAIEQHAPSYFIGQYQSKPPTREENHIIYSDIVDVETVPAAVAAALEEQIEVEQPQQPLWSKYVLQLRDAIPEFMKKSVMEEMQ